MLGIMEYKDIYFADKQRNGGGYALQYIRLMRKAQFSNGLFRFIYKKLMRCMTLFFGLEIPWNLKVGKGLYLGHAYNITIHPDCEIGEWCNIHKGVTIGQQNRGKRKGAPKIGNRVWIGVNATIVGKVVIGDDVLISPNAFVNCDVPSHSIVIGNPCEIHHHDNATMDYINQTS